LSAIAVICPGFHPPSLTQSLLDSIDWQGLDVLVFPSDRYPAYSGSDIYQFLREKQINPTQPAIFIGFSAGVVGAIAAAWLWQLFGGKVPTFIAFDGWGVPLGGDFPIYRFSHDYFTHVTSSWLGAGAGGFYADPPVDHLGLWRSPHTAKGYAGSHSMEITAGKYLENLIALNLPQSSNF
jgi:hypothetical protein